MFFMFKKIFHRPEEFYECNQPQDRGSVDSNETEVTGCSKVLKCELCIITLYCDILDTD